MKIRKSILAMAIITLSLASCTKDNNHDLFQALDQKIEEVDKSKPSPEFEFNP